MSYAIREDGLGWRAVNGPEDILETEVFSAEQPPAVTSSAEVLSIAERDRRLTAASFKIGPLQDAVDLGVATSEEQAALVAWKQYRVALMRTEQQPNYPGNVAWPELPV